MQSTRSFFRRYLDPKGRWRELITPPMCSLQHGCTGLAFASWHLGHSRAWPEFLDFGWEWLEVGEQLERMSDAYTHAPHGYLESITKPSSLFYGRLGLFATAMLLHASGRRDDRYKQDVERFVSCLQADRTHLDLVSGLAGQVLAASLILTRDSSLRANDAIMVSAGAAAEALKAATSERGFGTSNAPVGIAHGSSGVVYSLCTWGTAVRQQSFGTPVLDQLIRASSCTLGIRKWSTKGTDPALATSWCSGSAGMLHVLLAAHGVGVDIDCLSPAEETAAHIWQAGSRGLNLCCGAAGAAVALGRLGIAVNSSTWMERAKVLASKAFSQASLDNYMGPSLYRGGLGAALTHYDLLDFGWATMPAFSLVPVV